MFVFFSGNPPENPHETPRKPQQNSSKAESKGHRKSEVYWHVLFGEEDELPTRAHNPQLSLGKEQQNVLIFGRGSKGNPLKHSNHRFWVILFFTNWVF